MLTILFKLYQVQLSILYNTVINERNILKYLAYVGKDTPYQQLKGFQTKYLVNFLVLYNLLEFQYEKSLELLEIDKFARNYLNMSERLMKFIADKVNFEDIGFLMFLLDMNELNFFLGRLRANQNLFERLIRIVKSRSEPFEDKILSSAFSVQGENNRSNY